MGAHSAGGPLSIPEGLLHRAPIQIHPNLIISAQTLKRHLAQKQEVHLIDVRPANLYEKLRIPGSMNVPIHFISTKPFLKPSLIILVHSGISQKVLAAACEALNRSGFRIKFLAGGLAAWYREGGKLEGDLFVAEDLLWISPELFYQDKDVDPVLVIDASPGERKRAEDILPFAVSVPFENSAHQWIETVLKKVADHRAGPSLRIYILTEAGGNYERMMPLLASNGLKQFFFVQGGLRAYEGYLSQMVQSWRPRSERVAADTSCKPCAEKQSK
jgi:rhodanese-related sulfurtransferase